MKIIVDDLEGQPIRHMLEDHLDLMRSLSPPESVHALDLDALRASDVTFWTGWIDDTLVGCCALREIDEEHGEIKSMHTKQNLRGKGIAQKLLKHMEDEAKTRGYKRLSLETGRPDTFAPAQTLYLRNNYSECPPFAEYTEDPFSLCMTKELT